VLDETGKTLVNVAFPEREGTDVAGLRDRDGKAFVQEMLAAVAERESAWIDYWWPRPGDTAPTRKTSYVRRVEVGGKRLLVGAGVYLDRGGG
jgi:signal transduction histidine kinase